jgi:predicted HTH domain antitoxin
MAALPIPDDILKEAGLTEKEALVELACRLFDAGRLTLLNSARLAGLDRAGLEDALIERGIRIYRPTVDDVVQDLAALKRLGV